MKTLIAALLLVCACGGSDPCPEAKVCGSACIPYDADCCDDVGHFCSRGNHCGGSDNLTCVMDGYVLCTDPLMQLQCPADKGCVPLQPACNP